MNDSIPLGPEDKSIVIDENNRVLFSDFPPYALPGDRSLLDDQEYPSQDIKSIANKRAAKEALHLLDILDGKPQDILRLVHVEADFSGSEISHKAFKTARQKLIPELLT